MTALENEEYNKVNNLVSVYGFDTHKASFKTYKDR